MKKSLEVSSSRNIQIHTINEVEQNTNRTIVTTVWYIYFVAKLGVANTTRDIVLAWGSSRVQSVEGMVCMKVVFVSLLGLTMARLPSVSFYAVFVS